MLRRNTFGPSKCVRRETTKQRHSQHDFVEVLKVSGKAMQSDNMDSRAPTRNALCKITLATSNWAYAENRAHQHCSLPIHAARRHRLVCQGADPVAQLA